MKKWRVVRGTDDGCGLYQCLVCKESWESRTSGFPRCPYCGAVFEGQHECRPQWMPKWMYGRSCDGPYVKRGSQCKPSMAWRIETCDFHDDGTPSSSGWKFETECSKPESALKEYRRRVAEEKARQENENEFCFGMIMMYRIVRTEAKYSWTK